MRYLFFLCLIIELFGVISPVFARNLRCDTTQHFCTRMNIYALQRNMPKDGAQVDADNSRSDTIDVLHYDISLDLRDFSTQTLTGTCALRIVPKINNLTQVLLDLEDLQTTAVEVNGLPAVFAASGLLLRINLSIPAQISDTLDIVVHYNGLPPTASFGGFYFQGNYAYNMGVGIGVNPPNYGRAWFPCVDNFTERSTYSFHITTQNTHKAFCSGLLESVTDNTADATKTWHWRLHQTIPTYLASVAVSNFNTVAFEHQGIVGPISVQLGVVPTLENAMNASFIHLPQSITAFEEAWGAYRFDRIGYVIVPFGGGAMEHAANIAYPTFAINGNTQWETMMAHELSHHWFGNLVTCETASDMWLNEGWASYCEHLFNEKVYGKTYYNDKMRSLHAEMMQFAHVRDGSYLPVAGVPFNATYGTHVYSKGADVVHSLRSYMGDEAFFECVKNYLNEYAFRTANTLQLRDFLSSCSNKDLTPFFDDWVLQPGFADFSIDSIKAQNNPDGGVLATVYIRQRLYAATHYYEKVPLELTFFDGQLQAHTVTVLASGGCSAHTLLLPFFPFYVATDWNEKINNAASEYSRFIDQTGNVTFPDTKMSVTINSITDTALVRVVHHWTMPDRPDTPLPNGVVLSEKRYWSVEGYKTGQMNATAIFEYDGSAVGGNMDASLITGSENNLRLAFRQSSADEWELVANTSINTNGSASDKRGSISITNLRYGEYALAYVSSVPDALTTIVPACLLITSIPTLAPPDKPIALNIVPNPTSGQCRVMLPSAATDTQSLRLYNSSGKMIWQTKLAPQQNIADIALNHCPNGAYMLALYGQNGDWRGSTKVVVGGQP